MLEHPCGSYMDLIFSFSQDIFWGSELIRFRNGDVEVLSSQIDYGNQGLFTIGPFDMIETIDSVELVFQINAGIKTAKTGIEESILEDAEGDNDINRTVHVQLSGGLRYTYVELIDQVYYQNRELVARMAVNWLSGQPVRLWDRNYSVITAVNQNQGLLWPLFREIIGHDPDTPPSLGRRGLSDIIDLSELISALENDDAIRKRALLKDIDFWMF
jgi:hypothetical protein